MEENNYLDQQNELDLEIQKLRKTISTDRLDISFGEIINMYKNNELVIRPDYQRLFRWTDTQKTALIESILLTIPIPPIFVYEKIDGTWEIIDGLQRVSTIISFFGELKQDITTIIRPNDSEEDFEDFDNNNDSTNPTFGNYWKMLQGGLITKLENLTVEQLPTHLKINLKRAICRVEIMRGEENLEMKFELFKRLNSGGSILKPQEIRNAIFRGIDNRMNVLLEELSVNESFVKLTKLSNSKKMELYDQELVLRFIAFFNYEEINENTEIFLNNFMHKAVSSKTFDFDQFKNKFSETLNLLYTLDDPKIFRNSKNTFVPAYFEGITIGLAHNFEYYSMNLNLLKQKISNLKKDENFKKFSGSASNSKSRIKSRLIRVGEIFKKQENG